LKINLAKSELVPIGTMENVECLACRVSFWPMKYLGLLLGALLKKNQYWLVLLRKWIVIGWLEATLLV
jgi:hypothetical protein